MLESGTWAGLTTISKAASQLIVVKWIAVNFGPATLGVTGQAMSLIAILQALAGGGIANGIIRRFAVDAGAPESQRLFVAASFSYGLIFSTIFLAVALLLPKQISWAAFGSPSYSWFIVLLGLSSFFVFVSTLSQSLLSAMTLVQSIFWANFLGLAAGVFAFVWLVKVLNEPGILWGLVAIATVPTFFFIFQLWNKDWFQLSWLKPTWNPQLKKTLIPFTLIAVIGSALAPIIFVLLRTNIEEKLGWDHVGYWQAVLKVSDFVFSFIGLFIASTFFPRVAAAKTPDEALHRALQFALPFTVILAAALALTGLFGEYVLAAIYSDHYRFLSGELNILLFGGFFRALAWLSTFFLMARNHLKLFLAFEVLGSISLYAFCRIGLERGLSGLIWGQVLQSVFYLVILLIGILYLRYAKRL